MKLSSLTLALTAFNEEAPLSETVRKAVTFLSAATDDWELLIVDDGSTDRTNSIATELAQKDPRIRVLKHEVNRGMGAAIRTAIEGATKDWFCTIAADGQVNPEDLRAFIADTQEVRAVFSTYSTRRDGWDRKILSFGLRCLIALKSGTFTIPTGNYFIRRELLRSLRLRSESFFLNFEVFLGVRGLGVPIRWVQIPCSPRSTGSSKVRNLRTIFRVAKELFLYNSGA